MADASGHELARRMADLARSLAGPPSVKDVLAGVTTAAVELLPGADTAGALLIAKGGRFESLVGKPRRRRDAQTRQTREDERVAGRDVMRVIGFEEHYATRQFLAGPGRQFIERMSQGAAPGFLHDVDRLVEQLTDVGDGRIAEMDAAGVDLAVLSLTAPGLEQVEAAEAVAFARETNDFLADAIQQHPQRLRGFAALPTADPFAAADELERVVRGHWFVGAEINGHCQGRRLDDEFFWPILECAEALGVPIYLHPTRPPEAVVDLLYAGNYSAGVAELLSTTAWGWHIETAIHVLRLILSGAFDRFPRLQLMIGHMGEVLPFMLPRLDGVLPTKVTSLQRALSEYLRHNVYYTFAGFNWTPQFLELLLQVGVERMMFSTDYPYQSMSDGTAFLAGLSLTPGDRERIAHGNAESLLNI